MKAVENGVATLFVGAHYEVTNPGSGQTIAKYYFAGATRIAMRKYTIPSSMAVEYFLSDHIGSTSITTDTAGVKVSEMRYKPWGEVRYSWTAGQSTTPEYKLSSYTFTGQFSYMDDPSTSGVTEGFGLMFYNARWYDPALGRFAQADTIVPGGVQGLDRYAYVNNSPLNYVDPSGHESVCTGANADPECEKPDTWQLPFVDADYGIKFVEKWKARNQDIVRTAVQDVAAALLNAYNQSCGWSEDCIAYSAAAIFSAAYDTSAKNPLILQWGCSECNGAGGYTYSSHKIGFATLSESTIAYGGYRTDAMAFRDAVNNVVHELGHAFAKRWYNADGTYDPSGPLLNLPPGLVNNNNGFFPSPPEAALTWRQHPYPCAAGPNPYCGSEDFADMFLGWTYGKWDNDPLGMGRSRNAFMNSNMGIWIVDLVSP